MSVSVVLFFSIYLYVIFGGADFGVGVLEFFLRNKNKYLTKNIGYRVIGPVWEANHMWLILTIVIMWICFPSYYHIITTQLHIPITLLLIGIIARGTSFVFRHYDAYKDKSQKIYDTIFQVSCVFSTFFIGINGGALLSGELVHPTSFEGQSFKALFIDGWLNPFSFFTGVFMVSLSAFTSAVFLIGETTTEEQTYYIRKARNSNVVIALSSLFLFIEAYFSKRAIFDLLFLNTANLVLIPLAILLLVPLWYYLKHPNKNMSRAILSLQILIILLSWGVNAFPNLIITNLGEFSLLADKSEGTVFDTMSYSLLIASVFVLPGLYHLFKQFGLLSSTENSGK